ncbi:MAG: preprotein translocase subunit SecA [candidate division Zixibacteria bacterium]|nr:preprotein translocase subunit SecA [candidate division Zixibacteria bacterium]
MAFNFITKIFGSKHDKDIKKLAPIVDEINEIYESLHDKPDDWFTSRTEELKAELKPIGEEFLIHLEDNPDLEKERKKAAYQEILGDKLDEVLPEAFAMVKQACKRLTGKSWDTAGVDIEWDMIPYDCQLVGGIVLHQGTISEMATGEGKTLVATLPLYLNALVGQGAHLITVNDYLARRDANWMGKVFEFLGLTIGCIQNDMYPSERREQYGCDITYGTNNEFGFDYLRDNMSVRAEDMVQRGFFFAIIDEVDSVLIDEARTPLIISGPVESKMNERFIEMKPLVQNLVRRQNQLCSKLIADGEKSMDQGEDYEAGVSFLIAQRGAPKNKKLLKLYKEKGIKQLVQNVESDYMRDKKMHEINNQLYFSIDEREHNVSLEEPGRSHLSPGDQKLFEIPDIAEGLVAIDNDQNYNDDDRVRAKEELYRRHGELSDKNHAINQLLRAYQIYEKDNEYVVQEGKVMIVDEFTGRLMPGRRYSDGLHQAIEAKEGVTVEGETQTLATITLQNFFRMYHKLSGMTGTAETEAGELWEIYKLDVVVIPTNRPVRRIDEEDVIYRTRNEKYIAIIQEIVRLHKEHIPILVGTVSVEVSEILSKLLKREKIGHSVLNAKYHQQEAEIVQKAGRPGAVTIATNMAGRGTDIKLGEGIVKSPHCMLVSRADDENECPFYKELECQNDVPCGLHIIGTERHESRRIDRQLRGRSGRQGDPGSSRFFLSLEDELMRLFGSERIAAVMDRLGIQEGDVIEHSMVTKAIERAQKRVEAQNFSIRKHLLEYDDVMNNQREVVYTKRADCLKGKNLKDEVLELVPKVVENRVWEFCPEKEYPENWNLDGLREQSRKIFLLDFKWPEDDILKLDQHTVVDRLAKAALEIYDNKERLLGEETMRQLERFAYLSVIDNEWKEHLYEMDHLKTGIGLRAYGQRDPLIEFKKEGYRMFAEMLQLLDELAITYIYRLKPAGAEQPHQPKQQMVAAKQDAVGMGVATAAQAKAAQTGENGPTGYTGPMKEASESTQKKRPVRVEKKVGRNEPCPCGSGKKYKQCHGQTG